MYDKPVRKIRMSSRSVTGAVPGFGEYESTLERDFMEILRFQSNVKSFVAQPLTIKNESGDGKWRQYTPDGLVHFNAISNSVKLPLLYEIKDSEDFRKDWKTYILKFRTAKEFAEERNWTFSVFTQYHIRTPYLDNIKFLWRFKELKIEKEKIHFVLDRMLDLGESDYSVLLFSLCKSEMSRARYIPVIWHLIANDRIGCNLEEPLNMNVPIWQVEEV